MVFSDGFETGNFSRWSSANVNGGIAAGTVEAAALRSGSFGAHFVNDATAGTFANVRHTHAAANDITLTGWFRWNADSGSTANNGTGLRLLTAGVVRVVDIYRTDLSGQVFIRTRKADTTFQFSALVGTVALSTWAQLSLRAIYGGPGLTSRVIGQVNGTGGVDVSGLDLFSGDWVHDQIGTEHPQVVDVSVDDFTSTA